MIIGRPTKTITAAYTTTVADCGYRLICNSATPFTITLHTATGNYNFDVEIDNIGAGAVTIGGQVVEQNTHAHVGNNGGATWSVVVGGGAITKEAVENVLTGEISTHSHANPTNMSAEDLDDVPAYTGNANKVLAVKADESGMEYVATGEAANGVPSAGAAGQVLKKNSAADYDTIWGDENGLPIGGTTGQVLKKNSETNYDVIWGDDTGGSGFNYIVTAFTSVAIQAALTAAGSNGGGIVYLLPGSYVITEIVSIPSNTYLIGMGNVTFVRSAAINAIVMNASDGVTGGYNANKNIKVANIKFDANNVTYATQSTSLTFGHCSNVEINNCEFYGTTTSWHDLEINSSKQVVIDNCYFHNYTGSAECLQLDLAINSTAFPWFGPYDNTACKYVIIKNCVFEGLSPTATTVRAIGNHSFVAGYYPSYVVIEHCKFTNFYYTISLNDISHFTVRDNAFIECLLGVENIIQSNNKVDWKLLDNSYDLTYNAGESREGRFLITPGAGSTLTMLTGLVISGNKIKGGFTHGIGVTGTDILIQNNVITGCGKKAIYIYGANKVNIVNNILTGNNLKSEANSGDLVIGNNASVLSSNIEVTGNEIGYYYTGTNVDNILVTANMIINTATNASAECTVEANMIAGVWTVSNAISDARDVPIVDSGGNFTATDVEGALSELFTSVSNGKDAIAAAITAKGGNATGDDTFAVLASAIGGIPSGSGGYDVSDATALQSEILSGKTAYIATGKVTGTYEPPSATPDITNATAYEVASGTTLTGTVTAAVGDIVLATITTRSAITLPEGWISLYEGAAFDASTGQRISFAYKVIDTAGSVSFTATQATAARIYLNLIAISGANGIEYASEYKTTSATAVTSITVPNRATGDILIWGCSGPIWSTGTWITSHGGLPIVSLATTVAARQANFLDGLGPHVTNRTFTPVASTQLEVVAVRIT